MERVYILVFSLLCMACQSPKRSVEGSDSTKQKVVTTKVYISDDPSHYTGKSILSNDQSYLVAGTAYAEHSKSSWKGFILTVDKAFESTGGEVFWGR